MGRRKRPDNEPYNEDLGRSRKYPGDSEATERKVGKKDVRDFTRTSKHAPTEISSKKAVSRKRAVVRIHKHEARDPRFESVTGSLDEEKMKKDYAFLDAYRNSEIAELNAGLHKIIDPTVKETLKHALIRMESKKKTQQLKKQRQEVLRQHRKDESEKVEKGKKPFYLKRGELKERALVETFKGMKSRQVDKVMERRRKKRTAKERRGMPEERRG